MSELKDMELKEVLKKVLLELPLIVYPDNDKEIIDAFEPAITDWIKSRLPEEKELYYGIDGCRVPSREIGWNDCLKEIKTRLGVE